MPIRFVTYNIRNGRNGGLESELRGMAQNNMDLDIFQETKCTEGIYTRESDGYSVVTTDAPSQHRGGVALADHWSKNGGKTGNGTEGGTQGDGQWERKRTGNGKRGGRRG